MLRDITLGQYYPCTSVIHRLDPRTKLAGTMAFIISLFVSGTPAGYILASFVLAGCIKLSHVPFRFITKGLKMIIFILVLSVSFNIFLTDGREIFHIWILRATWEGLALAAFMAVRLVYLVIGSSMLTLTTTPSQLTDGLEKSLGFLRKFGLPVHEFAMMMSIALKFIPILVDETDRIMKAQSARGADFESGNLVERAKALVPILVPLFVSSFRRASDLALAMESRCYNGGAGRTKMRPLKYSDTDKKAYLLIALYFALMTASRFVHII